jgi:ML domain-containing protein
MAGFSYQDAGTGDAQFDLESISVSPDSPEPGHELTWTVRGNLAKPLNAGAYVRVMVKLGLVKLLMKTFDLEEVLRKMGVATPVPAGDFELVHTVTVPKDTPRAKLSISADAYTADEEDLFAVVFKVDFMKHPF